MLSAALRPLKARSGICILTSLNDFLNTPPLVSPPFRRTVWSDAPRNNLNDSFYDITVEEYAKRPVSKLTLHHMLESGRDAWFDHSKVLESARFTCEELPKRLARRLLDLQLLPYIVVNNPHILQVYQSYRHAFDILRDYPIPQTMAENDKFSALLRRLVDEHAPMLDALANGLREIKRKPLVGPHLHLDSFLETMLRSRISRRVLAEHHINLNNSRPGYIGIICTDLSLSESIDFAAGRSKQVCIETYGVAPEVVVSGDIALRVPYIPAHLDYMLYELLKNASRAVVERHLRSQNHHHNKSTSSTTVRFPPIHVRICGGTDDVTLRISDQGGGIPFHLLKKVWEFGWTDLDAENQSKEKEGERGEGVGREGLGLDTTTTNKSGLGGSLGGTGIDFTSPTGSTSSGRFRMAGLGFGLPLSRLYARYFGGDLKILSMPGYGTDAFLYLKGLVAEGKRDWAEHGAATHITSTSSSTINNNTSTTNDNSSNSYSDDSAMPRDEEGIGALGVSPTSGVNIS